ncbi:PAS domain S-box protein [Haladaptatus sp. NG-WS-4]
MGTSGDVLGETLSVFTAVQPPTTPLTTSEVSDALECTRRAAYDRLDRLVERGDIETKKVGARGRVWWRPHADTSDTSDGSQRDDELTRSVLEELSETALVTDDDGAFTYIGPNAHRVFGYSVEEIDGMGTVDTLLGGMPVDSEDVRTGGELTDVERTVTDAAGDERRIRISVTSVEVGDGSVLYTCREVPDYEERDQDARTQRDQFESLVQTVEEYAIFVLDTDGTVASWNTGAERVEGYHSEEIVGENFSRFYTDEDRHRGVPERNLAEARKTGGLQEEGWRVRKDGSRFWATVSITPLHDDDGTLRGYVKVIRDMTDRRDYERELRFERNHVERILETSPTGIVVFSEDGEVTRTNARAMEIIGVPDGDVSDYSTDDWDVSDSSGDPVPFEEWPAVRALETGEPVTNREVRTVGVDGVERWISVNATPLESGVEKCEEVVVALTDITQLKEQARRLEHQRDDLRHELDEVFDRVNDGVFALDDDWRFDYVNERAASFFEEPESELLGQSIWNLFPDLTAYESYDTFRRAVETEQSVSYEEYYEPNDTWLEAHVYPSETGVSVYFRDVTERKEREQELERYETIVETIWDGVYALDPDERFVRANDAFLEMTGFDRDELLGKHASVVHSETINDAAAELSEEVQTGEREVATIDFDLRTADGELIPVESRFGPYRYDDDAVARTGVVRDVTERKQFEEMLKALHSSSRAFLGARSSEDVSQIAVETATEVLDLPGVVVYRFDDDRNLLYPETCSVETGFIRQAFPEVPPDDSSTTGHVFAGGVSRYYEDIRESPHLNVDHSDTEMRSGLFVPMNDHGILIIGSGEVDAFDDETRHLVESLVANAEAAYDRVEHEHELSQQREQLAALDDLNAVVRKINEALIQQSTREEIEQVVCEHLAESDSYLFAWTSEFDPKTQSITSRVAASDDGYTDEITLSVDPNDPTGHGPTGKAVRTKSMQVTHDALTDPSFEPWQEYAEKYGFRSSAAIPLVHEDTLYGILGVYTERKAAFQHEEREVIGQLGEMIGHAIAAIERKHALMGDQLVEVDLQVRDVFEAVDVETAIDDPITLDRTVPVANGTYLQYGTTTEEIADELAELTDEIPHWEELTVLSEQFGESRFELRLSEPPIVLAVASHGGSIERVTVKDGDLQMTLHLPPSVDVRRVIDSIKREFSTVDMVARRQVNRPEISPNRIQRVFTNELTERQRTSLEAAFYSGFFEWPRNSSGEDIADTLGVSAPTFHQHIRLAEQKLFEALFTEVTSTSE